MSEKELNRQFEERVLRRKYIEAVGAACGEDVAHAYLTRAAKERVSAMVNAWRNAPIQGGVADIMLAGYAELHERLARIPSAWPVQTVHDSVVVECHRDDAAEVMEAVCESLESASLRFCPDVTPKADIDVRTTLADSDVVREYVADSATAAKVIADAQAGSAPGELVELEPVDDETPPTEVAEEPVQLQLGIA